MIYISSLQYFRGSVVTIKINGMPGHFLSAEPMSYRESANWESNRQYICLVQQAENWSR